MKLTKKLIAATTLTAISGLANADMVLGFDCITNNNANNCAIGEAQLSVDITEQSNNRLLFTIRNAVGGVASVITAVYFDNGPLLNIQGLIDRDQGVGGLSGVDFSTGSVTPPKLPGGNSISPKFEETTSLSIDADNPGPQRGIGPNEWLGVIFNLQNGKTAIDAYNALTSGDLRIGLHVQSFANGGSESFVNNPLSPVPLPGAFWLMLSGLALFARKIKVSH